MNYINILFKISSSKSLALRFGYRNVRNSQVLHAKHYRDVSRNFANQSLYESVNAYYVFNFNEKYFYICIIWNLENNCSNLYNYFYYIFSVKKGLVFHGMYLMHIILWVFVSSSNSSISPSLNETCFWPFYNVILRRIQLFWLYKLKHWKSIINFGLVKQCVYTYSTIEK